MLEVNYKIELGRISIEQNGHTFDLGIYKANCEYGAVVWRGKDEEGNDKAILMTFWADEQHMKNLMKDRGDIMCGETVTGAELNMYYEKNQTLLKYMKRSGYKVRCYTKAPEQN